jgi:hypothetical protein
MYYKGTKNQCQYYNRKVYKGTESMKQDPFTTSYASIREVEENFYILKHKDFDSNMQEVSELPIDPLNNIQP